MSGGNRSSQGAAPDSSAQSFAGKHTPGPWVVWSSLYEGMGAAVVRDAEPLETIAEVRKYNNAHLIAAAPDLLAALKLAQRLVEEAIPKFDWGRSVLDGNAIQLLNEVPTAIRAAIARAEGRPQ